MTTSTPKTDWSDLVETTLEAPFGQLGMPAPLEQKFIDEQVLSRFSYLIRSGWLALAIFNGFLLVDWLLVPDVFWQAVFVRVVVFSPICLVILLLAQYHFSTNFDKNTIHFLTDPLTIFAGWGVAVSLIFILLSSSGSSAHFYIAGILPIIVYGNLVQKLFFGNAIIFTGGLLLISQAGVLMNNYQPSKIDFLLLLFLFAAGIVTLVANFVGWKNKKRNFLLRMRENIVIEDLSAANIRLEKVSRSDPLTGVFNRRHLDEHLALIWRRAKISNASVTVLMLDVDYFKAFNDHYGHQAGDECLKHIATALTQYLRKPGDLIARYGGEEFVAVLHPVTHEEALDIAERVRRIIEDLRMRHERSLVAPVVTVSIGIGVYVQPKQSSADSGGDQLIALADKALYAAKNAGRNRVHMLTSDDSVAT